MPTCVICRGYHRTIDCPREKKILLAEVEIKTPEGVWVPVTIEKLWARIPCVTIDGDVSFHAAALRELLRGAEGDSLREASVSGPEGEVDISLSEKLVRIPLGDARKAVGERYLLLPTEELVQFLTEVLE